VRHVRVIAFVVVVIIASAGACCAQQMPASAATIPAKSTVGGFYAWAAGEWRSVGLGTFDLGLTATAGGSNLGPIHSYNLRTDGYGVAGAVGYVLPSWALPAAYGTNVRVEIGLDYAAADARQSQAGSVGTSAWTRLDGSATFLNFPLCTGCSVSSALTTAYQAWHLSAKGASDYRLGGVTLTPSLTLFSGQSRLNHDFTQSTFDRATAGGPVTDTYTATIAVRWSDIGIKLGLDTRVPVGGPVTAGLGGMVGIAHREASLTANDALLNGQTQTASTSTLGTHQHREVLVAGAKADLTAQLPNGVVASAFAGVEYDDKVPGIAAPTYALAGASGTPASLQFTSQVSYFAGGGITARFPQ
jgi:hypothetical protein